MNLEDRQEIFALQKEQALLRMTMERVENRLAKIADRIANEPPVTPSPLPGRALVPPPLPKDDETGGVRPDSGSADDLSRRSPSATPTSPIAPESPPQPAGVSEARRPPPFSDHSTEAGRSRPRESLEIRLGTFWLPIAGIVILVTGLVFLGNYAWHQWVHRLAAGGKLALLFLTGAALGEIGRRLGSSRRELRNYSRILISGGAATVYYATYAAHFVSSLRIVESPLVGGTLLLALGGVFAWWAHRLKSESIALLTVLLGYYTAAINPIGEFTLFSNLLLTAVSVFFLVRNRWAAVSWAALLGTYGSYGCWQWQHAAESLHAGTAAANDFRLNVVFVLCYWMLFTAATFFAPSEAFPPTRRIPFLTLNNAAFFAFASQQFAERAPDDYWRLPLGSGAVLLVLAGAASKRRAAAPAIDGPYLAQGLILVTLGLIAKITGPQIAVVLALESAALLSGARSRHRRIFQVAGAVAAVCAFVEACQDVPDDPHRMAIVRGCVAAVLIFDAWWLKKLRGTLAALKFEWRAALFAVPALILSMNILRLEVADAWVPAAYALAAVLFVGSIYLVRLPEFLLPAQALPIHAAALWILRYGPESTPKLWWEPLPIAAAVLALGHWWQRQRVFPVLEDRRSALQLVFAVGLTALGAFWMWPYFQGDARLAAASIAALATLAYGLLTGAWAVMLAGQAFTALGCSLFLGSLGGAHPHWAAGLLPVAVLGATSLAASTTAARRFPSAVPPELFPAVAAVYRVCGMAMLGLWGREYAPEEWRVAFYAGVGSAMILAGGLTRNRERISIGLVYAAVGLGVFWIGLSIPIQFHDLLALALVPASLRFSERRAAVFLSEFAVVRTIFTAAAVASIWWWVTRWTSEFHEPAMLTVSWALLAPVVFAAGLALRERVYRLAGFAILALAVGRVFAHDVWGLDTIYRILSFLVLGIVLLLLGFVYNRFAETIRKWL